MFPAFSAGKKFSSKIGLGQVLGITILHLCAKNQKKLIKQFCTKSRKLVFPAFSAGKSFFSKIGLCHILGIAILHLCAKNQKKLMSQSREKQKIGKWSKGISPKNENPYFATKKIFPGKTVSATFYGTLHSIFLPKIRKN